MQRNAIERRFLFVCVCVVAVGVFLSFLNWEEGNKWVFMTCSFEKETYTKRNKRLQSLRCLNLGPLDHNNYNVEAIHYQIVGLRPPLIFPLVFLDIQGSATFCSKPPVIKTYLLPLYVLEKANRSF